MSFDFSFRDPSAMLVSVTAYLDNRVNDFRNVRDFVDNPVYAGVPEEEIPPFQGKIFSLNYGRVVAAEFGYAFLLVLALVETVVRTVLFIPALPLFVCSCLPMRETNQDPVLIGDYVADFTLIGAYISALTVMNCATALFNNWYEPEITLNRFCIP